MICGLDEAGRGPLAGPVCAAAVVLPPDFPREILGDSKKLSKEKREAARGIIMKDALAWGIGWADHEEIDKINILRASLLAMERAFEALAAMLAGPGGAGLPLSALEAIVDGLYIPEIAIPCIALVKADGKIPEVMAASILAKTERDREMERYAKLYPQYGYEKHKGYPTKAHREAVLRYGPSPIQRLSFRVKGDIQPELFGEG
ncbi:ribonuclease HII [Treponema primitia ZAS-2]|uniref:Ribonuclease HII n=1 Tax=Treponema primitia (strain ATCC BAA-887 / DSM 12427 / ZAS-2) TaxID=545694 RepID=F5YPY4_TREPZ|nr:ribonuclease HII [Treponema primitia]AEF84585.1 ribonuclease HII [Treponema primitia ZAS-2]